MGPVCGYLGTPKTVYKIGLLEWATWASWSNGNIPCRYSIHGRQRWRIPARKEAVDSNRRQVTWCSTWKELRMVNIQAKTVVFWLTARTPTTQVIPSRGSRTTNPLRAVLVKNKLGYVIHKESSANSTSSQYSTARICIVRYNGPSKPDAMPLRYIHLHVI